MNDATPDGRPLVVASGLKKAYQIGDRRLEVLRGVSLQVARGEFVALRGASGAGKSTLLHLLGGLDQPDSGRIEFEGTELSGRSLSSLAEFRNRHVGIIFQAYHLLADLTALENVYLPARMARVPGSEALRRAESLLRRVGLGDRMTHRPSQMSGGEQQRVAIARCLVNSPALVLADEPTGNLDSHTGDGVMDLLLELRQEHRMTLVIATHDARVAARAEREVRLVDGLAEG
jgi:ABC-type lipoprotein export system ATPase subunit